MASLALYPPIVDSYSPAFIASSDAVCRVFFSLSNFNSINDFQTVQATVVKQDSGLSVVDEKTDSDGHYRKTGIILNLIPHAVSGKDNLYYVDILNSDLKSVEKGYTGWIPGWIYKIQLRLSIVTYSGDGTDQASWVNLNSSKFSEWSTVCVTKAIGQDTLTIYNFNFDGVQTDAISYLTELNFYGNYKNEDSSELLANYRVQTELEDSGILKANNDKDSLQYFSYTFKKEYQYNVPYTLTFTYETINKYANTVTFNFVLETSGQPEVDIKAITYEENGEVMSELTSPAREEDDGGILLKLYSENNITYVGSICIRRTDNKSNWTEWTDIKILNIKNERINDLDPFYDLTVESGVYYKYCVQPIDIDGYRGTMNKNSTVSMRNFEYSFLLGEGGKQLRLSYNNEMNNFKITVGDGKTDTLGGKYAFFSRNGDTYYKAFPITGLISFNMDENHLFTTKEELYGSSTIVNMYEQYNRAHEIIKYDYIYEKLFRDAVYTFLYDGKPKLFKSSTEGNVVVRLTDIGFSPNKTTNRMIYSFSANAFEMADANIETYAKYGFFSLGSYSKEEFEETESHNGKVSFTVLPGTDLIEQLVNQLKEVVEIGGVTYTKEVTEISDVMLAFQSDPIPAKELNGETLLGHPMTYNKTSSIICYDEVYDFGEYITFEPSKGSLVVDGDITLPPSEQQNVVVDVYCNYKTVNKVVQGSSSEPGVISRNYTRVVGQVDEIVNPDADIFDIIYDRYYYDSGSVEIELYSLNKIVIEAPQYATFTINNEQVTVGETGIYVAPAEADTTFTELSYLGMLNPGTGDIDETSAAVLITYRGTIIKKIYKES